MSLLLVKNRKATFEYEVLEKLEAGILLEGHEVKSLRNGGGNLTGSYISLKGGEAWIEKFHIALYEKATLQSYTPERPRKLLLSKKEIHHLITAMSGQQGLTVIPLSCIAKGPWIKVEIALARGKKQYDKRESIKKRDIERRIRGDREF